jgi:hypothetical protein
MHSNCLSPQGLIEMQHELLSPSASGLRHRESAHSKSERFAWNCFRECNLVGGVRIGMSDVERFRATVDMFTQLDDRFGGGQARAALIQYLSTDADRLLRGRYADNAGQALFSAVAEATLLAWMSYDSRPGSALAQRYFIQALSLAQAWGDRLLGASVLDAMSHQATYRGRFGEAASLARAATAGTQGGYAHAHVAFPRHGSARPGPDGRREERMRAGQLVMWMLIGVSAARGWLPPGEDARTAEVRYTLQR